MRAANACIDGRDWGCAREQLDRAQAAGVDTSAMRARAGVEALADGKAAAAVQRLAIAELHLRPQQLPRML